MKVIVVNHLIMQITLRGYICTIVGKGIINMFVIIIAHIKTHLKDEVNDEKSSISYDDLH